MRNKILKGISALSAAAMLSGVLPVMAAETEMVTVTVFEDDFSSYGKSALPSLGTTEYGAYTNPYTDAEGVEHASTAIDAEGNYLIESRDVAVGNDVWTAKTVNGPWGTDSASTKPCAPAGMKADPSNASNIVLAIGNYTATIYQYPTIELNPEKCNLDDTAAYTYEFDMRKTNTPGTTASGGIRFNVSSDRKSYYELMFPTGNKYNGVTSALVRKVVDGAETILTSTLEPASFVTISGNKGWYSVTLKVDGGTFTWTLENGGSVVLTGSCTDTGELLKQGENTLEFFAGGQSGAFVLYDNLKITKNIEVLKDTGDFETFDVTEDMTANYLAGVGGDDKQLAGDWYIRSSFSNEYSGFDSKAIFGIAQNPDGAGKVLKIQAKAAYGDQGVYPLAYNAAWIPEASKTAKYKFDFYQSGTLSGSGIRFNYIRVSSLDKSFYELTFEGGDGAKKTTLRKITNSSAGKNYYAELEPVIVTEEGQSSQISEKVWYTAEVAVNGGYISWTLKNAATGALIETGSYYDKSPIIPVTGSTMLPTMLFSVGKQEEYSYFDNTSFSLETPVTGYEITSCADGAAVVQAPAAGNAIVIFAAYSDNILTSASYEVKALKYGENAVMAKDGFSAEGADFVKVMLWKNGSVESLCGAQEYKAE